MVYSFPPGLLINILLHRTIVNSSCLVIRRFFLAAMDPLPYSGVVIVVPKFAF
jgi:hypothetical protein